MPRVVSICPVSQFKAANSIVKLKIKYVIRLFFQKKRYFYMFVELKLQRQPDGVSQMNRLENRRLIEEIEILREQLHRSCVSNGKMTPSDDAYRISIKLDQLILEIMKAG